MPKNDLEDAMRTLFTAWVLGLISLSIAHAKIPRDFSLGDRWYIAIHGSERTNCDYAVGGKLDSDQYHECEMTFIKMRANRHCKRIMGRSKARAVGQVAKYPEYAGRPIHLGEAHEAFDINNDLEIVKTTAQFGVEGTNGAHAGPMYLVGVSCL